ncbi:MAG: DUF1934 domain-containing protein [Lachnospiraceae bacterium]|nr:DUF1934 domain-containing protein [Lachnospiraceae bacterium]
MEKDVIIAIRGLQFVGSDDPEEPIELIIPGLYYYKNDTHYIVYEEKGPNERDQSRTIIRAREDRVELTRSGDQAMSMIFDPSEKNQTRMDTPFGQLMMGVQTNDIVIDEMEGGMDIRVNYYLDINYDRYAQCRVELRIRSKEKGAEIFSPAS